MLGFIADSLNTVTSVLFPVYASYKALRTSDPAQLTPWLMYWTTLSLFFAGESMFQPVLRWIPLYSWFRLGLHLYLVLPGQQGSVYIYRNHLHPFLDRHERRVDQLITNAHDKAKQGGLDYLNQALEYVMVNILKFPPKQPPPAPESSSSTASYSQTLLSRFAIPSARANAAAAVAGSGDLLSLLGNTMQQVMTTTKSRDAQVQELASSGALVPTHLSSSPSERSNFIATQQDRLRTLLQAYEREAASEPPVSPTGTSKDQLKKSKSEAEFVDLAGEHVPANGDKRPAVARQGTGSSSGWGSWIFGGASKQQSATGPVTPEKKTD